MPNERSIKFTTSWLKDAIKNVALCIRRLNAIGDIPMDRTSFTRRKTLLVGAASLTALAGCVSGESETSGESDGRAGTR